MAWNTLVYACGHTETKQLYGPMVQRAAIVAKAATRPCDVCKAREAEIAGNPILHGTPAQVSWAIDIREELTPKINDLRDKYAQVVKAIDAGAGPQGMAEDVRQGQRADALAAIRALDKALAQGQATWWINRRNSPVSRLVEV